MAVLELCLSVLFVFVIASTPIVHSRSLRRHRGHHSHPNYYDLKESMSRDLSGHFEDDLINGDSYERKPESHGYPGILDRLRNHKPLRQQKDLRRYDNDGYETSSMRFFARRKRHNKHPVSYRPLNREAGSDLINDKMMDNRMELLHNSSENGFPRMFYELEVKEAQNSTICSYTVESIPIPRIHGTREPKNLEHVRCNHIGERCQGDNPYCCIQTYRNVEVSYGDGYRETIKLYVGCVCAHKVLLRESVLPIND